MKLIHQNDLTRPILQKFLLEGICQVTFKKVDKTVRVIFCTLNPTYLPSKYLQSIQVTLQTGANRDVIPVWDVNDGSWKSFRISNVLSFSSEEELLKNDDEGQDVKSDQQETLDILKTRADEFAEGSYERHLQQVKESKEKAEQVRQAIRLRIEQTKKGI